MARWSAKEVILKIDSTKEAILFLDTIQKQIKTVDIIADYYPGKVTVRFEGAKENLKDATEQARAIHLMIRKMLYPDLEGMYHYNLNFIPKLLKKTIPTKVLLRVLRFKDYKVEREEELLFTNVTFDALSSLIQTINDLLEEMPYEISTNSLRQVLTTIAIVKDEPLSKAIARAKKAKIVTVDDLARMKLIMEPDQALEKCLQ